MKLYEICFSPTGGTKKAADMLAAELAEEIQFIDLTDPGLDFEYMELPEDSLALIAVPSYGGRVPEPAVNRLAAIKGCGSRAVLLCVYGNRAFEDTLTELEDTAKQAGFQVTAAAAAIAEHSIARQFASGRPDAQDQAKLQDFGRQIKAKLDSGDTSEPAIPGNRPYKKRGGSGMVPKPDKNCVSCGLCAQKCPVQAIDQNDPKKVDADACFSCMRCVSVCPHSARKVNSLMLAGVSAMLSKVCSQRRECELFL